MATQDRIKELLDYKDGMLFWKVKKVSQRKAGERAGSLAKDTGRRIIGIDLRRYREHVIIWILHNGPIPNGLEIDHKDRNPLNNKIENLRVCTHRDNNRNLSLSKLNTSGYKGVSWSKTMNKWESRIKCNNKNIILGYYDKKEDAALAYNEGAVKYFGEFASLNTIK